MTDSVTIERVGLAIRRIRVWKPSAPRDSNSLPLSTDSNETNIAATKKRSRPITEAALRS